MEYYDSNMIKPVEGLGNITGISAARRREERKRRQQLHQESENSEQQTDGTIDEKAQENPSGVWDDNNSDNDKIDYCA